MVSEAKQADAMDGIGMRRTAHFATALLGVAYSLLVGLLIFRRFEWHYLIPMLVELRLSLPKSQIRA
jgi:hypothetical protein